MSDTYFSLGFILTTDGAILSAPVSDGTDGQVLATDGSGALEFVDVGVDVTADYAWTGTHSFSSTTTIATSGTLDIATDNGSSWRFENVGNTLGLTQVSGGDNFVLTSYGGSFQFRARDADISTTTKGFVSLSTNISGSNTQAFQIDAVSRTAARIVSRGRTNQSREVFAFDGQWADATDATRKARVDFNVYDTDARLFLRADATGSEAAVTGYGAWAWTGAHTHSQPLNVASAATFGDPVQVQLKLNGSTLRVRNAEDNGSGSFSCGTLTAGTTSISGTLTIASLRSGSVFYRSTTVLSGRDAADTQITWIDSTDATRKARVDFNVYDTDAREFMSAEASGTAAKISFFGEAPVTRPQVTAAGVTAADLLTALDSLGLLESI